MSRQPPRNAQSGSGTKPERPTSIDQLEQVSTLPMKPRSDTLTDAAVPARKVEIAYKKGSMLDRFMVLDKLGAGGMGVVVSAFDPQLDRKVAIKLLRPKSLTAYSDAEARARLVREAKAMARITHPNVITVHEVGEVGGEVFVAMEYVEGGTLKDAMSFGNRDWRTMLDLFVAAGRGLAAAHRKGLVHRDFKPDNVLVDPDMDRVLVTDFGLVSIRDESSQLALLPPSRSGKPVSDTLTETGAVMGTPAYMAPEQHLGRTTDARSDQFSFCAALWEAVYGQRPFDGDDIEELAGNVLCGNLRRPKKSRIPSWLRELLERGLSVEPERRFSSMDELLEIISARTRRSTPRLGAMAMAGAAAVVVALGLGVLQASGDDAAETALERIAELEATIQAKDAQIAVKTAELEVAVAQHQAVEQDRIRRIESERLAIQAQREAAERELVELEEQQMLLAPNGFKQRRSQSITERRTLAKRSPRAERSTLDVATPRPPPPSRTEGGAEPRIPPVPSRTDIKAGLAEVRSDVMRCGELKDFSSSRSYDRWKKAELSRYSGAVNITLHIRPNGRVAKVTVRDAPSQVARCIRRAVRKATFIRSEDGRKYTYVFTFPGRM